VAGTIVGPADVSLAL